jgi:hypothetical protein
LVSTTGTNLRSHSIDKLNHYDRRTAVHSVSSLFHNRNFRVSPHSSVDPAWILRSDWFRHTGAGIGPHCIRTVRRHSSSTHAHDRQHDHAALAVHSNMRVPFMLLPCMLRDRLGRVRVNENAAAAGDHGGLIPGYCTDRIATVLAMSSSIRIEPWILLLKRAACSGSGSTLCAAHTGPAARSSQQQQSSVSSQQQSGPGAWWVRGGCGPVALACL